MIKLLLQKGADPDTIDHNGDTPLYWAAKIGDIAMARLLLNAGAKPNKSEHSITNDPNDEGENPKKYEHFGDTPLLVAGKICDRDLVQCGKVYATQGNPVSDKLCNYP